MGFQSPLPPLVNLQVEPGFSGRVLLQVENGDVTSQMQLPADCMVGNLNMLVDAAKRAGWSVSPVRE